MPCGKKYRIAKWKKAVKNKIGKKRLGKKITKKQKAWIIKSYKKIVLKK